MDFSGLPCPPLDEAGLMPMAFDLCQFFDGVDDSGNEIKNGNLGRVKQQVGGGKQLESLLLHPRTDSDVSPNLGRVKQQVGRGKQLESLLLHPKTDSNGGPTSESELKLLRAGIKLREGYEKAENLKKRKAIQVIEFQPLSEPKKSTKRSRRGASSTKFAKRR